MTEKEAKKIIRSIGKCSSYIFENRNYLVKVARQLNGYSFSVWCDDNDETTWCPTWFYSKTQKRVLAELNKLGFIDQEF